MLCVYTGYCYGYRHKPFGIRARILNAECIDFATAPEIVLREDGSNGDIGYTWLVQLDKNHVLVFIISIRIMETDILPELFYRIIELTMLFTVLSEMEKC